MKVKVAEVGAEEIRYKKFDNPEGPLFILRRNEVFMIKYENGTKDIFMSTAGADNTSVKRKDSGAELKSFIPLIYATASLPVGAFGSESDEDGSAAKLGFSFGHTGIFHLSDERLFLIYDLSCNINPYSLSGVVGYQIPNPPYYYYEVITIKGNYFNNLALFGIRYTAGSFSSPFYMEFSSGLNLPAITGFLKDESNFKPLAGIAAKASAGVWIKKHFDFGVTYLFSRPKWKYDVVFFMATTNSLSNKKSLCCSLNSVMLFNLC